MMGSDFPPESVLEEQFRKSSAGRIDENISLASPERIDAGDISNFRLPS